MFEIHMQEVSAAFAECWQAAAQHLHRQGQGAIYWLRAHLRPPILEHLSFRLGNQLFFICLDVEGVSPFSERDARALRTIADSCQGHACIMPIKRRPDGWIAAAPGWGLLEMTTRRAVHPPTFVTDERIPMSDWELQDLAVQVVREKLEDEGRELMSWQSDPSVDPSLWFVGDDGPEWVVVRFARYPQASADPPSNWVRITESCAQLSTRGHFASVILANADTPVDETGAPVPPFRGHAIDVIYRGLASPPRVDN